MTKQLQSPFVVIYNIFGSRNTGDAALIACMIKILNSLGLENNSISLLCMDPVDESHFHDQDHAFSSRICNRKDYSSLFWFGISLLSGYFYALTGLLRSIFVLTLPKAHRQSIALLSHSKLSISCPGGYLEDSNNSYYVNILQILLASRISKHTILAPQSIGPINSKLGRFLLSLALRRSDSIFIRETSSRSFVSNLWPRVPVGKYSLSGDLALMLRRGSQRKYNSSSLPDNFAWGLTVVDWNFPNMPNPNRLRNEYITALIETSEYIFSLCGVPGIILNQVDADSGFAKSILCKTNTLVFDETLYSYSDMISRISDFDFFIGSRFHSCIFAICNSVPFLSISYLPKSTGILDQLKLSDLSIDINSCKPNLLQSVQSKLFDLTSLSNRIFNSAKDYNSLYLSSFFQSLKDYV